MSNSENGKAAQKTTLIEEGTSFQGSFSSQCPIVVKGQIQGDIAGPSLTVSSTGAVAGTVKVGLIESEGELSGEFEADVIRLSGRVRDNTVIRAKSLEVKLAPEKGMMQVIFGECALDVGDMPEKSEALSAAVAAPAKETPAAAADAAAPAADAKSDAAKDGAKTAAASAEPKDAGAKDGAASAEPKDAGAKAKDGAASAEPKDAGAKDGAAANAASTTDADAAKEAGPKGAASGNDASAGAARVGAAPPPPLPERKNGGKGKGARTSTMPPPNR